MLSSQAEPSTFKHDGFTIGILTFSTKRRYRSEAGLASDAELKAIDKEIDAEVADCVEFALAAPEPKPEELTRYIWAED